MRAAFLTALVLVALPAFAQDADKKKKLDPNQVICRTEELIGSRLQAQRTCLTRLQWQQRAQEQRRTVERVQDFRPVNGG